MLYTVILLHKSEGGEGVGFPATFILGQSLKIDMKNAFNEVSRASIIEALEEDPSLRHLAGQAAAVLAPASGLESGGVQWGKLCRGNCSR